MLASRLVRAVGAAAVALALGGCWFVPGQDANRSAYNASEPAISPANVGTLQQLFSVAVGGGTGSGGVGAPVVSRYGVHAVVAGCGVVTVGAADGHRVWPSSLSCDTNMPTRRDYSPPFVDGERVLSGWQAIYNTVPGQDVINGASEERDAATGAPLATSLPNWGVTARVRVQPGVANGLVFTGSADGSVDAFAAASCGATTCPALWSATTGSPILGALAIEAGHVYVGTQDNRIVAYALPSSVLTWAFPPEIRWPAGVARP